MEFGEASTDLLQEYTLPDSLDGEDHHATLPGKGPPTIEESIVIGGSRQERAASV